MGKNHRHRGLTAGMVIVSLEKQAQLILDDVDKLTEEDIARLKHARADISKKLERERRR